MVEIMLGWTCNSDCEKKAMCFVKQPDAEGKKHNCVI